MILIICLFPHLLCILCLFGLKFTSLFNIFCPYFEEGNFTPLYIHFISLHLTLHNYTFHYFTLPLVYFTLLLITLLCITWLAPLHSTSTSILHYFTNFTLHDFTFWEITFLIQFLIFKAFKYSHKFSYCGSQYFVHIFEFYPLK